MKGHREYTRDWNAGREEKAWNGTVCSRQFHPLKDVLPA
jgi:hypothetical protein